MNLHERVLSALACRVCRAYQYLVAPTLPPHSFNSPKNKMISHFLAITEPFMSTTYYNHLIRRTSYSPPRPSIIKGCSMLSSSSIYVQYVDNVIIGAPLAVTAELLDHFKVPCIPSLSSPLPSILSSFQVIPSCSLPPPNNRPSIRFDRAISAKLPLEL